MTPDSAPINPISVDIFDVLDSRSSQKSYFPFLKLPAETRNYIYSSLLANGIVIIYPYNKSHFQQNQIFKKISHRTILANNKPYSISILLVCSQIHKEARLIPYTNTFEIQCRHTLPRFLDHRAPDQLRLIRSLVVSSNLFRRCEGSIFAEFMRLAAEKASGVEELEVAVMLSHETAMLEREALWVKGVGAWMGRGLKDGVVTIGKIYGAGYPPYWEEIAERLAEDLSKELTAGET